MQPCSSTEQPRDSQERPSRPKRRPRSAQERPEAAQGRTKDGQVTPQRTPNPSRIHFKTRLEHNLCRKLCWTGSGNDFALFCGLKTKLAICNNHTKTQEKLWFSHVRNFFASRTCAHDKPPKKTVSDLPNSPQTPENPTRSDPKREKKDEHE